MAVTWEDGDLLRARWLASPLDDRHEVGEVKRVRKLAGVDDELGVGGASVK